MRNSRIVASAALLTLLSSTSALAASDSDIQALRSEIQSMRQSYENRIADLEAKLKTVEKKQAAAPAQTAAAPVSTDASGRKTYDNSFNPSIGIILNGTYGAFSEKNSGVAGFALPGEGARGKEGLKLGESELNFSSNVDDKFRGSVTASFVNEDGEDGIEIEESFVETLPGMGLPTGMNIKAGRALWTLGYLNELHAHTDDFADRPLPYRVFLNNAYNDDGAEITYVLPTDFYSEIGGGAFRGDDYPFGNASGSSVGAWSAFARVGGDIGDNQSWRVGGTMLSGDTSGRASNEDVVNFTGDSRFYAADLRYIWVPTGNAREQEVILQGEYFWRNEDGSYEDTDAATGAVAFDDHTSGWYAQAVYKFHPQWRVGTRYSRLETPAVPVGLTGSMLDSGGHNPQAYAAMIDWTNSEFSRVRLQYNREDLAQGQNDNQILLQYIMSIGAHAAHKY
jgi:hypothetical protein